MSRMASLKSSMQTSIFSSTSGGSVSSSRSISGRYLRKARMAASRTRAAKVSTDKTVGVVEHPRHVEVVGDGHLAGVNVHDFTPAFSVGHANLDFTVKAAWASQGWVKRITSVGSADDHHVVTTLHAVHQGQHLSDHARRSTSPVTSSRLGQMESISSMNTMAGALSAASSKISRSCFSDSP